MASRVVLEVCVFIVLLVLISVQVVVYWACNQTSQLEHEAPYGVDMANVTLRQATGMKNLSVSMRSENCFKCDFENVTTLSPGQSYSQFMDTTHPIQFRVYDLQSGKVLANTSAHFEEGSYWCCDIGYNTSRQWQAKCIKDENGDNAYLPILYASVVGVTLSLLWVLWSFLLRYFKERGYMKLLHLNFMDRLMHKDLGVPISSRSGSFLNYGATDRTSLLESNYADPLTMPPDLPTQKTTSMKSKRLVSLDAFRGMSLVVMIFVNYGGGGYWFFDHSKWNGLTVADLVFPWFIWIMGVSLVFSFKGRKSDSLWMQLYQIARRSIILFAIGLFLSASSDTPLPNLRIPGVLQRFAATYLVVALTEALASRVYRKKPPKDLSVGCSCFSLLRSAQTQESHNRFNFFIMSCDLFKDLVNNWIQWIVLLLLELIWLLLTFLVHNSQCPRGYLGPGGITKSGSYFNCTGGAAGIIDQWLLGNGHLYDEPTAKDLYHLKLNYDPEGVLGTLNSIVLCFLGVQAGRIFQHFKGRHAAIIIRLILWGTVLSVIGTVLCLGQKNGGWIPINKNLWSLSFILIMGGTGNLVLSFFYFTIDGTRWWNGSPFRYPGTNSIIVYVGHILLGGYFPFDIYQQEKTHLTYLTANLVAVCVWMLIAFYWYSIGFFVKI